METVVFIFSIDLDINRPNNRYVLYSVVKLCQILKLSIYLTPLHAHKFVHKAGLMSQAVYLILFCFWQNISYINREFSSQSYSNDKKDCVKFNLVLNLLCS